MLHWYKILKISYFSNFFCGHVAGFKLRINIYLQNAIKFISLDNKYLVFVLYLIEYRLKSISKSFRQFVWIRVVKDWNPSSTTDVKVYMYVIFSTCALNWQFTLFKHWPGLYITVLHVQRVQMYHSWWTFTISTVDFNNHYIINICQSSLRIFQKTWTAICGGKPSHWLWKSLPAIY